MAIACDAVLEDCVRTTAFSVVASLTATAGIGLLAFNGYLQYKFSRAPHLTRLRACCVVSTVAVLSSLIPGQNYELGKLWIFLFTYFLIMMSTQWMKNMVDIAYTAVSFVAKTPAWLTWYIRFMAIFFALWFAITVALATGTNVFGCSIPGFLFVGGVVVASLMIEIPYAVAYFTLSKALKQHFRDIRKSDMMTQDENSDDSAYYKRVLRRLRVWMGLMVFAWFTSLMLFSFLIAQGLIATGGVAEDTLTGADSTGPQDCDFNTVIASVLVPMVPTFGMVWTTKVPRTSKERGSSGASSNTSDSKVTKNAARLAARSAAKDSQPSRVPTLDKPLRSVDIDTDGKSLSRAAQSV